MGLAPEVEPPPGFETRVLARVLPDRGSTSPLSGWRRARRRTRNRWAAVAVVGSLLGGGTAGWWVGEHRAVPSANRGVDTSPLEEAGFVSGDRRVGELFAYRSGHPWVYMVIDAPQVSGVLTCQLRDASGRFVTVGSFDLRQGQGYWGAPVPAGAHIVAARLLDSTGRQVALARLAAHGSADPDPVS